MVQPWPTPWIEYKTECANMAVSLLDTVNVSLNLSKVMLQYKVKTNVLRTAFVKLVTLGLNPRTTALLNEPRMPSAEIPRWRLLMLQLPPAAPETKPLRAHRPQEGRSQHRTRTNK